METILNVFLEAPILRVLTTGTEGGGGGITPLSALFNSVARCHSRE